MFPESPSGPPPRPAYPPLLPNPMSTAHSRRCCPYCVPEDQAEAPSKRQFLNLWRRSMGAEVRNART
jgi:hypothetical protein